MVNYYQVKESDLVLHQHSDGNVETKEDSDRNHTVDFVVTVVHDLDHDLDQVQDLKHILEVDHDLQIQMTQSQRVLNENVIICNIA